MRGRRGANRARCKHRPCMVEPVEGGQEAFYARCMVCGKMGPTRPSSEEAYQALVSDDVEEEGRSEDEGGRG